MTIPLFWVVQMFNAGRFFGCFNAYTVLANAPLSPIAFKTKKPYLKILESGYGSDLLTPQMLINKHKAIFFYSNDASYIPTYLETCYSSMPQTSIQSNRIPSLGMVVGNGYILSLLPEICADDILLLDRVPLVHYFIFAVRELILHAPLNGDFVQLKKMLINQISLIEQSINNTLGITKALMTIQDEMKTLGSKHFLANEVRYIQCREALQAKELVPIEIDISNIEQMNALSEAVELSQCVVSFVNLTNVAEYTGNDKLYSVIENLPLADDFEIITTQLVRDKNNRTCNVSRSLSEFKEALVFQEPSSQMDTVLNSLMWS